MIKAICFDLDGVYFTPEGKRKFHENLIDLGADEDRVAHMLYKSNEMFQFVRGELDESYFWDYFRFYLGINKTNEEFIELWINGYKVDNEVRELILKLKKNGYKICTCSNNNPSRIRGLEDKFGFLSDFDTTVFSYEVNAVKPSKAIFQTLIERSGVKPEEIVYSDDNPARLQGAIELGINTFLYLTFKQFKASLESLDVDIT